MVPRKYEVGSDAAELPGERVFFAREAPLRLPSAYLAELESQGWTVVENVMSEAMVSNLVANITKVREDNAEKDARVKALQDERPYRSNDNVIRPRALMREGESFLGMTPAVAQALMHPISLTTQNEQQIAGAGEVHGKESIILMPRFVEVPKVNRHDGLADLGRAEGHAD